MLARLRLYWFTRQRIRAASSDSLRGLVDNTLVTPVNGLCQAITS